MLVFVEVSLIVAVIVIVFISFVEVRGLAFVALSGLGFNGGQFAHEIGFVFWREMRRWFHLALLR